MLIERILSDAAEGDDDVRRLAYAALGLVFETWFLGVPETVTIAALDLLGYGNAGALVSISEEDVERCLVAVDWALSTDRVLPEAMFAASRTANDQRYSRLLEHVLTRAVETGDGRELYQALSAYLDLSSEPLPDLIASVLRRSDVPDAQLLAKAHLET